MINKSKYNNIQYECLSGNNLDTKIVEVKVTYLRDNKIHDKIVIVPKIDNGDNDYYINEAKVLFDKQISNGEPLVESKSKLDKNKLIKRIILGSAIALISLIIILLATGVFGSLETVIRVLKTNWLDIGAENPKLFGWFHITCICTTLMVTMLLVIFARKVKDKHYRIIVFAFFALIFIFEIFKEVLITYQVDLNTGHISVNYDWTQFPFQICSTPYYTLPFIVFLKDGKVRKAFESYGALFIFIGGFANYCFPETVFFDSIFLTVQSMVHHGVMIAISIYIAVYNRKNINLRNFLPSTLLFTSFVIIAVILNEVMWQLVPAIHNGYCFNMFFISTHFECTLPIFKEIFNNPSIPKWVSIIIFTVGFSALSYVVLLIQSLIINHKIKPCISFNKNNYPQLSKK